MADVGDSLGRYTLLRRLAAGGMGEVYVAAKAGPVGFGPYVALKILREELAIDRQFVDMLVDEANISMFLNHQNVVSVLDLSEDQGRYYIAMEFVQGVTVERLVDARSQSGKKPDIPLGLYIATELCRALKYAHTRVNHAGEPLNIVHRDVTPANILLSTQGEVKLTDFGIARAKGRIHQTQAGVLKGKFGYMAPEMVRYEKIDARADIFCAGVCVYLMITGRHPVAGAAVMEAIQMFEERRVPPPKQFNPDISSNLSDIVMKALEPKVDNRWASAAAFGDALQDVTLQNPTWRREVQGGSRLLTQRIKEVAGEVFDEPVERDALEDLLQEIRKKDGAAKAYTAKPLRKIAEDESTASDSNNSSMVTIAPSGPGPSPAASAGSSGFEDTDDVEIDTAEKLPAISEDINFAPTPESGEPDFETEESLSLSDILKAAEPGPSVPTSGPDTDEDEDDEPAPRRRTERGLAFPDSSTDRNRVHDEMMAEPALPSSAKGGTGDSLDDQTFAGGFDFGDDPTVGAPQTSDMDDGATAPGIVEDEEDEFAAPTIATPAVSVHQLPLAGSASSTDDLEDGRTLSGVAMVDGVDEEFADAATIVPSGERHYPDLEDDDDDDLVRYSGDDDWEGGQTEADDTSGDATLLDGIDAAAVQREANRRKAAAAPSVALVRDESDDAHLQELVLDSIRTGETSAKDPAGAGPADPADAPRPIEGPLRIVMHEDGPALARDPVRHAEPVQPARPAAHERKRPTNHPNHPLVQPQPMEAPHELDIGPETGKWMAGKIDGSSLDWSDDAAARRAVAARGNQPQAQAPAAPPWSPQPQHSYPPPQQYPARAQPSYSQPQLQQSSFMGRNWMVIATFGVALGLLGVLGYLWLFTNTFWPKLKLDSNPPGAVVTVDGSLVAGKTPLLVRVEPEKRHLIEFRLDGFKRALREITEGIGRGRTYTLTVDLERQPPRLDLPVEGTLFINDAQAGQGKTIFLTDLPASGEVRLRIEAEGYKPYQNVFDSAKDIPERMDIPLVKAHE